MSNIRTMLSRSHRIFVALAATCTLPALTPSVQAQQDNQGFIYGTVTTESGTEYVGFLRWGSQEGFWDDLFHSTKEDLPFRRYAARSERDRGGRGTTVRVLDRSIRVQYSGSHQFIARFGDIAAIEPYRRGRTLILMKNGNEYEVEGGGDTSDPVHVRDTALGDIDVRWDRIRSIDFSAAPRGADPGASRLYGVVESDEGGFEGFIQWDQDEGMSTDVLDGDTADGEVSIRMGSIRMIERLSRQASLVTLVDGRELRLEGSNDVNADNRGIMVEDELYGRLSVAWQSFDRVTFSEPGSSGRSYADFPALAELDGTVTTTDGQRFSGRIAYDLDEGEGWEMLNGELGQVSFDIPLASVVAIEPGRDEARVVLRSGEELVLDGTHDVSEDNSGVLVFAGEDPLYIAWREVERIEFNR